MFGLLLHNPGSNFVMMTFRFVALGGCLSQLKTPCGWWRYHNEWNVLCLLPRVSRVKVRCWQLALCRSTSRKGGNGRHRRGAHRGTMLRGTEDDGLLPRVGTVGVKADDGVKGALAVRPQMLVGTWVLRQNHLARGRGTACRYSGPCILPWDLRKIAGHLWC